MYENNAHQVLKIIILLNTNYNEWVENKIWLWEVLEDPAKLEERSTWTIKLEIENILEI